MKHQFLKSVLVLGSVLTFINCSEEATNAAGSIDPNTITENLVPSSATVPVSSATVTPTDQPTTPNIPGTSAANGQTTISSPSVNPGLSSAATQPGTSSPNVPQGISSSSVAKAGSSNSAKPTSSAAVKPQSSAAADKKSSSSTEQPQIVGKITVTGSLTQTVAKGASISKITFSGVESEPQRNWKLHFLQANYDKNAKTYTLEGSIPDYWNESQATEEITIDGQKFSFVLTLAGNSTPQPGSSATSNNEKSSSSQQQQQPKSSSSVKTSSSSVASSSSVKSSSSQANTNAAAEESQYLNAGAGGQQGFATRYWDCCMPHCAWPEHGGSAKTCDAKGKTPISNTNGSFCSGGQGTTCTSQMPIIVSDKLAYAFAATPGNDNTCGKCFALTFTGTGKYETKKNHEMLKGKTLVVMASNIGYDVQGGQFDIMIPGGGFGAFNGCSQMGWNIQTNTTYGGLLSDCENESGYDGDVYSKRKQCLTEKCNKSFPNDTEAKEGCLFLATWMEAAGNPNHTYKEVPCPAALKAKY
ncbi:MAG: glycosyl hydrolase family 5 [Fibrobacter sp.]|nr:glycosyl hydrolase family 5 [Fibrobacter sp.]